MSAAAQTRRGVRLFRSAEAAWLWCAAQLIARRDGRPPRADLGEGGVERPCTPDDILNQLDRLHRAGRLTLDQARVLRRYGDAQRSPSPAMLGEEKDWRAWRAAMAALGEALVARGIVAPQRPREAAWGRR
ncbi:hypothetical protein [Rubritepida flocculans]|uniref:hypothetical protein n=1 Tax=Rubritepida flocculans TaxID=182403 RepID=UPI0004203145|nr:hypothetical protein [Rubritepida flocculans]